MKHPYCLVTRPICPGGLPVACWQLIEKGVVKIMRNSLRLEVNEITETCYTGGLCGQSLYRDAKSVNIQLWADIGEESYKIDEVDFDV